MQTINSALNNQSQFSHNSATIMTPTNQIAQPKQNIPNEQSRLIVVHHTLPWSFSPTRIVSIESSSNPAPVVNGETRTHRLRARSFSNLNPKGGSSIHCIRPSISNILSQENMNGQSWELKERSNHPALFAGEAQEIEKIFIGWPGHCLDSNGREVDVPDDGTRIELESLYSEKAAIPVFIPTEIAHNAFNGYHSNMLWPLLHYAIKDVPLLDAMNQKILWEAFQKVNRLYLDVVSKVYRPGDCVLVMGVQLMLLPTLLKEELSTDIPIGFYLTSPFPSSEVYRCLPQAKAVLEGMLGAKVIGFQDYSYIRHFISSCARVLGVEHTPTGIFMDNSSVFFSVLPIGVDPVRVQKYLESENVKERIKNLREIYKDKHVLVGVDKSEQVRGVKHKLIGFKRLLQKYPEWIGKVVLIQVLTPDILLDSKTEARVSELASEINCEYGSLEYMPVQLLTQLIQPDEYFSLLSIADVFVMTPERDANPFTPFDFVLCQKGNYGTMVLGEFTAQKHAFKEAIWVNPWDHTTVADKINDALLMDKSERIQHYQAMLDRLIHYDAKRWATSMVYDINFRRDFDTATASTPLLDVNKVKRDYQSAWKRYFFLDYDGTLTAIQRIPSAAIPNERTLKALTRLTSDAKNHVYIVSGRDQATLQNWLGGVPRLGFSAEHGCFFREVDSNDWNSSEECMDDSWKESVLPVFEYFTERTVGSFIEHKTASLVWHYRLADPDFGEFQARECLANLELILDKHKNIEVISGKKNLEVRPSGTNKGELVKKIVQQASPDFIFCVGDDRTDEDMFRTLSMMHGSGDESVPESAGKRSTHFITCVIGPANKPSSAAVRLESPADLILTLESIMG